MESIPERFRTAAFENYIPADNRQEHALEVVLQNTNGNLFLWGGYGRGKTHLASAQYRTLVDAGKPCAWRSMGELLEELRIASVRDETSRVIQSCRYAESFHLFVDDLDKFKSTEFKHEVLFELFDLIYRRKLGITVTSNYGLAFLIETERVHPAIVRRLDDVCRVVEV
jgi:DNA replication protein DnaC